jgi:drug/metabolite transporter (DMT)-like permease
MTEPTDPTAPRHPPAAWSVALAFALVYVCWGTTYLAIKEGVKAFPPALFAGTRIGLAGLLLAGYLGWRGQLERLTGRELVRTLAAGVLLFVGGNGLITVGERTVDSGAASVLVATTPLWMALLEWAWPWGERLNLLGWLGLVAGLAGVCLLLAPRLHDPSAFFSDAGPLLVLGSAASWAAGSVFLRYVRGANGHLSSATWQMLVGGAALVLIGVAVGELRQLTAECFTLPAVVSFVHLLIAGSLVGFVAYNWLLSHVSATQAGTYAYVNPVVAILVGWLLGGERLTGWIVGGMAVILVGVALVRTGGRKPPASRRPDDLPAGALDAPRSARPLAPAKHGLPGLER